MNKVQQEAMAVLEAAAKYPPRDGLFLTSTYARAIIDMLADPRIYDDVMRKLGKSVAVMPEEPTAEALEAMRLQLVPGTRHNQVALAYRALFEEKFGVETNIIPKYRAVIRSLIERVRTLEAALEGLNDDGCYGACQHYGLGKKHSAACEAARAALKEPAHG